MLSILAMHVRVCRGANARGNTNKNKQDSSSRFHQTFSVKRELREIVDPSRDGWLRPSEPRGTSGLGVCGGLNVLNVSLGLGGKPHVGVSSAWRMTGV